ncbi:MAG TPA: PaaI family thioesterase [Kiloniellales bacterium]|nr:PaaI family thioesterase [Kiloniellales bacterium]
MRDSFARQSVMRTIGAALTAVAPGEVEIRLPWRADLCQQHGFIHAGIVATIADSAAGYAAFSLFPAEASVLTSEFKLHLLAPAEGELLVAHGRVLKPGRTLTIAETEVRALKAGREKLCAKLIGTLVVLAARPDMPDAG